VNGGVALSFLAEFGYDAARIDELRAAGACA
jgi:hypothetical protein